MHPSRFDIAIVGSNLTARMIAALLAKHGKRVLLLATAAYRDPWQYPSLFTEKLLEMLSGLDILDSNQPLQVLSTRARVTIGPNFPFDLELRREFGSTANTLTALFDELERSGSRLEELLWEYGGLPAGDMRSTLAWRWLCLRRKFPVTQLQMPLTRRLHSIPDPAGEWLRDLFQGLSLRPLASLTVADAALLWANVRRPGVYDGNLLDRLLRKRFEQFHGTEIAIDALDGLEHGHGQWNGNLPDGKRFQATQLILGDLDLSLPGHGPLPVQHCLPPARRFATSPLDGQISALLEKRVIAGGALPVRMSFTSATGGLIGEVSASPDTDEPGVRCQLEPILPFAQYTLSPLATARRDIGMTGSAVAPSIFKLPLHSGNHLWCADETRLLPQLGNSGAALLAWTLARRIDSTIVSHAD